jgi:hypothetical protein
MYGNVHYYLALAKKSPQNSIFQRAQRQSEVMKVYRDWEEKKRDGIRGFFVFHRAQLKRLLHLPRILHQCFKGRAAGKFNDHHGNHSSRSLGASPN